MGDGQMIQGDALAVLHDRFGDESVQCVVTSPPYWGLRDYGMEGQIGLEQTPEEYVAKLVEVFREVRRVLKSDGTLWLNLGDSFAGSWGNYHPHSPPGKHGQRLKETARWNRPAYQSQEFLPPTAQIKGLKPKDLVGIPWRVAFALQADGWYLRSDVIWAKPNPMPESVTDRPTKAHEYMFLLSKSEQYYYDAHAIKEQVSDLSRLGQDCGRWGNATKSSRAEANMREQSGNEASGAHWIMGDSRNKRSVWTVATQPYAEAHFATFPPKLIEPCVLAGCPPGGLVLDPFAGSGTTLMVARQLGRQAVGIELNPAYIALAEERCRQGALPLDG